MLPPGNSVGAANQADDVATARREVAQFLTGLGWPDIAGDTAESMSMLAEALVALRRLGRDVGPEVFTPYELSTIDPAAPAERLIEDVVIGTVVFESALVALRRLAHATHSAARFSNTAPAGVARSRSSCRCDPDTTWQVCLADPVSAAWLT